MIERRTVQVHVEPERWPAETDQQVVCGNSLMGEVHEFRCTTYRHEGDTSEPSDRWYRLIDVDTYFTDAFGRPLQASVRSKVQSWHSLVVRYNTTLQGLSYRVRDLDVGPDTLFINAHVLKQETGRMFV